jgi:steroid delta-isomerase-like uncharacterized protein
MPQEENVSIARDFYAAWNDRDFDRSAALMADDAEILIVGTGERYRGPAGAIEFDHMWADGFPDGRVEIMETIAEGDRVVVLYRGRGTQTGTLKSSAGEIPATGKEVTLDLCDVYEIRGGKVRSLHTYFDSGSLLTQLGVMQMESAQATV